MLSERAEEPMHAPRELSVAILAAGRGTRLGGPKALFELAGEPLLLRILRTLDAVGTELRCGLDIAVVCGADRERVRELLGRSMPHLEARIVANDAPERERTLSLRLACQALPPALPLLVWPVDVPLVARRTLRELLRAPLPARAFRSPCSAERGGHPVLLGAELREELLALRDDETLRELRDRATTQRERLAVDDPLILLDLDTPRDVEHALRELAAAPPERPENGDQRPT
ncbi:MAG: NTP transferase domain-containing protein [Planctomycetes bacterium]|nr:NTP transferase domain-containing protein [Planctomycetota bacterium]